MKRLLLVLMLLVLPASAGAQTETVEYYGLDAVGSVRVVFDPSGTILARLDYAPFGQELAPSAKAPDRKFAGLFRDAEAGLDYAEARSYQVRTGRFNAPDPVYAGLFQPQRWNRYAYALNSPATFIDPFGLCALPDGGQCPQFTDSVTVVGKPTYPEVFTRPWGGGFAGGDIGDVFELDIGNSNAGAGAGVGTFVVSVVDALLGTTGASAPGLTPTPPSPTPGVLTAVTAAAVSMVVSKKIPSFPAAKVPTPRLLTPSITIPLGNTKAGLEHILRRHSYQALTTSPASKFSHGMGHIEVRGLIHEAAGRSTAWRVEGNSRVLDVGMGRVIGTDLSGRPTQGLRVVTDVHGSVITSYPIPW